MKHGIDKVEKIKILLISYHFYPDAAIGARRPTQFAKSLNEAGYDVDVLTVLRSNVSDIHFINALYTVKEYHDPIDKLWGMIKKVKKYFIGNEGEKNISAIKKPQNHLEPLEIEKESFLPESLLQKFRRYFFSFQALLSAKKIWTLSCLLKLCSLRIKQNNYNVIITSSPPSSINILGLVAKRLFNATWVCDLRDPIIQWGDVRPDTISVPRVAIEEFLERKYLGLADTIIVTTPSFETEVNEKIRHFNNKKKVLLLYNGYDNSRIVEDDFSVDDSLNIVYAGSLYMNRDPFPFLGAIQSILNESPKLEEVISVNFYGDCNCFKGVYLNKWIMNEGLTSSIKIHGNISADDLDAVYQQADILVVFAQGQARQIPAKIFEYMPYHATIIAVTEPDSDTAKLLENIDSCKVTQSNIHEISKVISGIYKDKKGGRLVSQSGDIKLYSRKVQNKILVKECNRLTSEK